MQLQSQSISVRTGSWCGDTVIDLPMPSHWQVSVHDIVDAPALVEKEIAERIKCWAQTVSLVPGRKVAIVVDDHTRPTPVDEVLKPLLAHFESCGVSRRDVKIIVAVGTHLFRDTRILEFKLGTAMAWGAEVVVPDCRRDEDYKYQGLTPSGVPVYINRHFADADVRIAISGVYPHDEVSFSGGAKILIGVLGLETISRIHRRHGLIDRGATVDNSFRAELETMAELVCLHHSISCTLTRDKRLAQVYCGGFREAFRAAVQDARKRYIADVDRDADVIVSNAYPLDTALCVLGKSTWPFKQAKAGSQKILLTSLCDCPAGRVMLASSKGERIRQAVKRHMGLSWLKRMTRDLRSARTLSTSLEGRWRGSHVVYVAHRGPGCHDRPARIDGSRVEFDWNRIVLDLQELFGLTTPIRVSVYACAPLLYPSREGLPPVASIVGTTERETT